MPVKHRLRIIRSTDSSGYSTAIANGGRRWSIHFVRHELRLWVDSNWNEDPPHISGEDSLSHFKRVVEQIRDERDEHERAERLLRALRQWASTLDGRGLHRLSVFGSVARGKATPDSDIDIAVEFKGTSEHPPKVLAKLESDLRKVLGHPVDLRDWQSLHDNVRDVAESEAVEILTQPFDANADADSIPA